MAKNTKKHADLPEMKGLELPTLKNAAPPAQDYDEDKDLAYTRCREETPRRATGTGRLSAEGE